MSCGATLLFKQPKDANTDVEASFFTNVYLALLIDRCDQTLRKSSELILVYWDEYWQKQTSITYVNFPHHD